MADKKLKVTLVKSVIGTKQSHRATVIGLGLRRINHTVELLDWATGGPKPEPLATRAAVR